MSEPNPTEDLKQQTAGGQTASLWATQDAAQQSASAPQAARSGAASAVQVPGYRIEGVLGRGGMGVVYQAIQEKANRAVALKMILAGAHADSADQMRFRAEAEAAARLSHPNIVQLYEVGETPEGFPFFSLEYVAGGTLADRLKQGPLRAGEAAAFLEALARAMQYAHERGIVHRDLKPANILLAGSRSQESGGRGPESGIRGQESAIKTIQAATARTQRPAGPTAISSSLIRDAGNLVPKISDFGLAKQLDTQDGMTRTGAIMGTPAYMAPEQAFGRSKDVGPGADIYALGAILYECLTGRPPFRGATVADTLEQVRTMEPVTVRQFVKEIPADLETICLHCLHKEPLRRYATAEALADDLHRYRDHQPISVRPVSRWERGWRWCRRNPGVASLLGISALLLIAVAMVSTYAYFDAEARNVQIEKKRQEAEDAKREIAAQNVEIEKKRQEAVEAQKVAKGRLEQSLKALGLFATDFRAFSEDALVPGAAKTKMYEALIKQLEEQSFEETGELSEDGLRNKAWMYQTMAIVYLDTQKHAKAGPTIDKGLAVTQQWLNLKPGDAYAMSFHAAFLSLKGDSSMTEDERLKYYGETIKLREKLAGNPEVDQFTPGRSFMQLADSYDKIKEYDKSLALREKVCQEQVDKKVDAEKLYESFDFWAWTCWKAFLELDSTEARKQELLEKCEELSQRALGYRKGARRTLDRLSGVLRELGDREYNQAKQAEANKDAALAKKHADKAQVYFTKLADVARQLAIAPELMFSMSNYARSFYTIGLMQKGLGKHKEARESFETSRHVREQLVRDFGKTEYGAMLRIDLLFSRVALGEHAEAVRAADEIRARYGVAPGLAGLLYRLACIYSLSAAAVEEVRAPAPLTDADKKLQAEYRDKALTALEGSHTFGNLDFAGTRMDADLLEIKGDPRFQKILDLEKKIKK